MRRGRLLRLALFAFLPLTAAWAASEGAVHWSGDKTFYDTRANRMELIGHAAIHQNGESLFADKITFERDTKLVHAVGNAVYVGKTALLQGDEMHFNLETRTGTILGGRVSTDEFTLSGERINKLGADRFQAHRAEYSTCKDCPQSWTLSAADVDLQIQGYAYLSNVTAKVADAPAFWIPYLIVPIKTKRQTGLLIPQFGFQDGKFRFVIPFFWAISRSVDATIGLGNYGGRGKRQELELRYALDHGGGQANFYHLDDRRFRDYLKRFTNNTEGYSSSRWALHAEQGQELAFGIQEKFRAVDVGDAAYLVDVGPDVPGNGEGYLYSDISFSRPSDRISTYLFARRYRNLLIPAAEDPRRFDANTVQVFPQVDVTSTDKPFLNDHLVGGLSLGATNFVRSASFFDHNSADTVHTTTRPDGYREVYDPIREAVRAKVNPSVYSSFRLADSIAVVPHANYYQYFYDFNGKVPDLSRGYARFDTDIFMQFERIYDGPSADTPKVKHLIRPILNYSIIPYRHEPVHPFTGQIEYARQNGFTGFNFDNDDIVPMDATFNNAHYFAPQGNALSYGFDTQIIRKRKVAGGEGAATKYYYDQPVEWSAGQSFNFRELRNAEGSQRPLSRFYSLFTANFDKLSAHADYYYIPYQPVNDETSRHVYSTGFQWTPEKSTGRVLAYERSLGISYAFNRSNAQSQSQVISMNAIFSLNDYIMPGASLTYDLLRDRWQQANTTLTFQSPSECWKLDLGLYQNPCLTQEEGWCTNFRFNLSLNLTGSGFGLGSSQGMNASAQPPQ